MDYGSKRLNELADRHTRKTGLRIDTLRKRQKVIDAMPGTTSQLMERTGLSDSTIRMHLSALKREGFLNRTTVPNSKGRANMAGFFDTPLPKYTTDEETDNRHRMVTLVTSIVLKPNFKTIWANGVNPYGDQTYTRTDYVADLQWQRRVVLSVWGMEVQLQDHRTESLAEADRARRA